MIGALIVLGVIAGAVVVMVLAVLFDDGDDPVIRSEYDDR